MDESISGQRSSRRKWGWISALLLALIRAVGLYLRLTGIAWDEGHYLHPDERFLMFVESSIQPVHSISEFFNTDLSTLNPHNTGQTFFVYGTWPIFVVRYLLDVPYCDGSRRMKLYLPVADSPSGQRLAACGLLQCSHHEYE